MSKKPIRDELLKHTDQGLNVFQHYYPNFDGKKPSMKVRSFFREDGKEANANVYLDKKDKQWKYHDFVNGDQLDAFGFVMKAESLSFPDALEWISKTLTPYHSDRPGPSPNESKQALSPNLVPGSDYAYWRQYYPGIDLEKVMERYDVVSVASMETGKGSGRLVLNSTVNDPIFAFKLSRDCYKIYRPNAPASMGKHFWLGKKPAHYENVFGIPQLPASPPFILIVEGLKDCLVANAHGFHAVGVDNASTRIPVALMAKLKSQSAHVIACYDIDTPGKDNAKKLCQQHNINNLSLPDELLEKGGKDISDYFRLGFPSSDLQGLIQESMQNAPEISNPESQQDTPARRLVQIDRVEEKILERFELRNNIVSNTLEGREKNNPHAIFSPVNEHTILRFLHKRDVKIAMNLLKSLLLSDFVTEYDPFKAYFYGLTSYDPSTEPDYIEKLCDYLPTNDKDRFKIQFRKALVRTIACALDPLVINKQALILVHSMQNSGKTTFVRWLVPSALQSYIAENIATDKDGLLALCENFMINLDELSTLTKADINSLKSIFSKSEVKVRRPYDSRPSIGTRRASFFGSTNKQEFLSDETGSVRWLCFELKDRINWDYSKDLHVDDIWRQAYHLYTQGFDYQLSRDEIEENESRNNQYQELSSEMELLPKYFQPGSEEGYDHFLLATDILNQLMEKNPLLKFTPRNLKKALEFHNFTRTSKRTSNKPRWGYMVKTAPIENQPNF